MKIGLDLRFLEKGDLYSNYVFKLSQLLINNKKDDLFNVYLDLPFSHINFGTNTRNIVISDKPGSVKEQTSFLKKLNSDNNDLVIFFDFRKPVKYKKKYILFLENLVDFHYPPKKTILQKYFDNYLLNINSANAKKIICLNDLTKSEINDKLNVAENKISIIPGFYNNKKIESKNDIKLDIKLKYNIKGDYLIYSAGSGVYKNIDRLLKIFTNFKDKHIDISLVIIDDSTIKDVNIRKEIIQKGIQDKIYFLGNLETVEKQKLYKNSIGSIFPSLYESFPFSMEEAINFKSKIIASDIENIKNIFGDNIEYFSPINTNMIEESIIKLSKSKKKANYDDIFDKYNLNSSAQDLINIVNKV